jgi:hypothetical protein
LAVAVEKNNSSLLHSAVRSFSGFFISISDRERIRSQLGFFLFALKIVFMLLFDAEE